MLFLLDPVLCAGFRKCYMNRFYVPGTR